MANTKNDQQLLPLHDSYITNSNPRGFDSRTTLISLPLLQYCLATQTNEANNFKHPSPLFSSNSIRFSLTVQQSLTVLENLKIKYKNEKSKFTPPTNPLIQLLENTASFCLLWKSRNYRTFADLYLNELIYREHLYYWDFYQDTTDFIQM